jgi:hypothetical protein
MIRVLMLSKTVPIVQLPDICYIFVNNFILLVNYLWRMMRKYTVVMSQRSQKSHKIVFHKAPNPLTANDHQRTDGDTNICLFNRQMTWVCTVTLWRDIPNTVQPPLPSYICINTHTHTHAHAHAHARTHAHTHTHARAHTHTHTHTHTYMSPRQEQTKFRECLLPFDSESFAILPAVQECKG